MGNTITFKHKTPLLRKALLTVLGAAAIMPAASFAAYQLNDTIQAEDFNSNKSSGARINQGVVDYFNGGNYVCYDDVNMNGVNSLKISYARDSRFDRPSRLGIYIDNPSVGLVKNAFFDIENERYLGKV